MLKTIEVDELNSNNSTTLYKAQPTEIASSPFGKYVTVVLSLVRIFLTSVLLSTINVCTAIKLKQRLDKRQKILAKAKGYLLITKV